MLNYAKQFDIFCLLDNQEYSFTPHRYECLLGAGSVNGIQQYNHNEELIVSNRNKQWLFGHISFEKGYEFLDIHYIKKDSVGFPLSSFFIPEVIIYIQNGELNIEHDNAERIYDELMNCSMVEDEDVGFVKLKEEYSKAEYVDIVRQLQEHIHRGDCYEINFCQGFY